MSDAHGRVKVRDARVEDAPSVLDVYTPFVTETAISFEEVPPTVEEMEARIDRSHIWLVADQEGDIAGYSYASPFHGRGAYRWSIEVSVYLRRDRRRRGIGRELLGTLLDRAAAMGFVNAFAGIALPNEASIRLFRAFGFAEIGLWPAVGFKLGEWRDVSWWQRRLRDPTVPPPLLGPTAGARGPARRLLSHERSPRS
jgi:phosphinothricin acetyltransferase